jgi:RNA polymerase sigma-70 factor (ECF subfamily)
VRDETAPAGTTGVFPDWTDRSILPNHPPVAQSSDVDGFSTLYRRELRFVVHTVRRFGVPGPDVDDVVQEVFLVLFRRWHQLERGASLRPWLYGVARRVSRNHLRSHARRRTESLSTMSESRGALVLADTDEPRADQRVARAQAWNQLRRALGHLSPDRQRVFVLVELEQMKSSEVARALCRSPNTVSSQVRLARRDLRQLLERSRP